ncbi:uncharacterized protein LOC122507465 [Leptopilina heterotoma]|uniref:uncharacterized protein LOC122507465 n=1 Tax=Leptopilina heterotoma TaxID=63436 RepID=UPI001CA9148E|nr:uncharacterized protein LOC122507465 [Leptopilina heterotoma]
MYERIKPLIEATVTSLPNPFDSDYIAEVDDVDYMNLINKACRTEISKHEKSAEEPEMIFEFDIPGASQPIVTVGESSAKSLLPSDSACSVPVIASQQNISRKVENIKNQSPYLKSPSTKHSAANSVLYKGMNSNAGKIKNTERAQSFVDLASAKHELLVLQKMYLKEKNQLEIELLRLQLEKENLQIEVLKKQLQVVPVNC